MNVTIYRAALVVILAAIANIAWSESLEEESSQRDKICINIFERYLPVSTRYLLRPGFGESGSSELFTLACLDSPECFFQDAPTDLDQEAGLFTISIGHSPQEKLSVLDAIKTFRFVSDSEIDALRVRVYTHQSIDSVKFIPSTYLAVLYDDSLYMGIISSYKDFWKDVMGSMSSEDTCSN